MPRAREDMSKCRTLSRPLLHNWNTHSQSIILRRWHSTAHTMTRRPACEALVLASSIPVNVIAFESVEHFNIIRSPRLQCATPCRVLCAVVVFGAPHISKSIASHAWPPHCVIRTWWCLNRIQSHWHHVLGLVFGVFLSNRANLLNLRAAETEHAH